MVVGGYEPISIYGKRSYHTIHGHPGHNILSAGISSTLKRDIIELENYKSQDRNLHILLKIDTNFDRL